MPAYQPTPITPSSIEVKTGGYIFLVSGLGGVGKTSFAINSHGVDVPLYFANFDRDASHLLSKYEGDLMYLETYRRADSKPGALGELKRFRQFVDFARQEKQGVFVIDNAAAMWNIISKAFLPDEDRPAPKEYADANGFMRSLLLDMEDPTSQQFLLHQLRSSGFQPPRLVDSLSPTSGNTYSSMLWQRFISSVLERLQRSPQYRQRT